jgi:hypothetical protein
VLRSEHTNKGVILHLHLVNKQVGGVEDRIWMEVGQGTVRQDIGRWVSNGMG